MPYKIQGTTVMALKNGKWRPLKKHPTKKKALAHLGALKANVKHQEVNYGQS